MDKKEQMTTEKMKEEFAKLPKMVAYEDDIFLPEMIIHGGSAEEVVKFVKEIKYKDGDIFVCTFPKSGTHWLGNLMYRLCSTPEQTVAFAPTLVEISTPDFLDNLQSPRILFSHLRARRLPQEHMTNGGKIFVCLRNPKDVAVSLFHHSNKVEGLKMGVSWDQFLARFVSGQLPYKNYLDYLLEWDEFANKHKDLVTVVHYEDLKSDGVTNLRKIAQNLGLEKSDDELEHVLAECSIGNLRKEANERFSKLPSGDKTNEAKGLLDKDGKTVIYRKGEVGDWKNHFTVAQSEAYDKDIQQKLVNCSFKFRYEI